MTVWIVNPFDNLPLEGFRPQRYWLMAEAFVEAGHNVVYWTSDFNHTMKQKRVVIRDSDFVFREGGFTNHESRTTNHGSRFSVRFIPTLPYSRNVSLARIRSHLALAKSFQSIVNLNLQPQPSLVIASLPPIRLPLFAKTYADSVGAKFVVDIMDDWPGTFYRLLPRWLRWLGPLLFSGPRRHARYLYANADLVTGVADRYAELAMSSGTKCYRRFYHGIRLSRSGKDSASPAVSSPDSHTQLGMWFPNRSVLYLGNLGRTYDLRTAIEAVALDPQLTLDIAGKGEQEDSLKAFAAEKGVSVRVRFHGYLDEDGLAALASKCAYGLIPMSDESCVGIPYKLADYARFGLFMLSSLRGESAALLEKHHCGALYTPGDPRSLVEKSKSKVDGKSKSKVEVEQWSSISSDFDALLSELDANRIYRDYVAEVEKL